MVILAPFLDLFTNGSMCKETHLNRGTAINQGLGIIAQTDIDGAYYLCKCIKIYKRGWKTISQTPVEEVQYEVTEVI